MFGRINKKLKSLPDGQDVYDSVQPIAEGVKAIVQMIIGVTALMILIVQLCLHLSNSAVSLGDRALAIIIGVALAFSRAAGVRPGSRGPRRRHRPFDP
jgi:uncharacterized membrane protein YccC